MATSRLVRGVSIPAITSTLTPPGPLVSSTRPQAPGIIGIASDFEIYRSLMGGEDESQLQDISTSPSSRNTSHISLSFYGSPLNISDTSIPENPTSDEER